MLMKASQGSRTEASERGQTLIIFVVMISLLFLFAALAIDYGLWLSERRGIARAADLAALAAVQDLPADPSGQAVGSRAACGAVDACYAAFDWADRNGYGETTGAVVRVSYWCGNEIENPPPGICTNENKDIPAIAISPCPTGGTSEQGCDAINVTVEKEAASLMSLRFGGVNFDIGYSSWGSVTFRLTAIDAVVAVDASPSMGFGCNGGQTNPGCPIREARIGATAFADILLGNDPANGNVQVGYAPYRGCYTPPTNPDDECVPSVQEPFTLGNCSPPPGSSWVVCLTKNEGLLQNRITATQPEGFTNVCLGLYESRQILAGPGRSTDPLAKRFVVILTDGDNYFQNVNGVPNACTPANINGDGGNIDCGATPGQPERGLDRRTKALADQLRMDSNGDGDPDVEVYVVGLNVCGNDNANQFATAGYCGGIGNNNSDNTADRRLLKCIASSSDGTNDHYFETDDASTLGDIFGQVAYEIAGRGLTTGPP